MVDAALSLTVPLSVAPVVVIEVAALVVAVGAAGGGLICIVNVSVFPPVPRV